MGLFDVFNFKKKFQEIATKENFALLHEMIKEEIIKQIKAKIPGQEKMDAVVNKAIDFINKHMHSSNSIVQWIIDHVLIQGIRILAQSIYDDLKEVIKNL